MKRKVWNEYKQGYDEIPTMMVSRDGLLAIAHKSGHFDGIKTETIMNSDGTINGARCIVYNSACTHAIEAEVLFSEYCVYRKDKSGKTVPQALWATKPATMIRKVAESQALRRAFNVKGVYTQEELEAEIQKDTKTELEYMGDALTVTEKLNADPVAHEKWTEEIKTKILDDVLACQTTQELSHVKKQYEADIGRLMDKDRLYILEMVDNAFQNIVSGEEPEIQASGEVIDRKTGKEVALEVKAPVIEDLKGEMTEKDSITDLKERENFGKEFLKSAATELALCTTKAQLTVFKNKNIQNRMKLLAEDREYFDMLFKQTFAKVK